MSTEPTRVVPLRRMRALLPVVAAAAVVTAVLVVPRPDAVGDAEHRLMVSSSPDRTGAVPLMGQELDGMAYIHLDPAEGMRHVRYFVHVRRLGLFALSFMDEVNLAASSGTDELVADAIRRHAA